MFARDYFDTYWRPDLKDEVFVAMPFGDEFLPVWNDAIRPAIDDDIKTLKAKRVDATVLTGNVITHILDGIAHSKLIISDISIAQDGPWRGQRNGNVMYEVGLAHAVRQKTEVLLIRSDNEPITFDVAHISIQKYDRSNLAEARATISRLASDLLGQIEQEKSLKVRFAVEQLDTIAMKYIAIAVKNSFYGPDPGTTMGHILSYLPYQLSFSRLQQLGIVSRTSTVADGKVVFSITNFGKAVARHLGIVAPGAAVAP